MLSKKQKERIALWVKALRSGKFKQTRDVLRRGDKFCCLGVACEIYRQETGKGKWVTSGEDSSCQTFQATKTDGNDVAIPYKVCKWFGIKSPEGKIREKTENEAQNKADGPYLSSMNDKGKKFTTIARAIEANLETLSTLNG